MGMSWGDVEKAEDLIAQFEVLMLDESPTKLLAEAVLLLLRASVRDFYDSIQD